MSVTIKRSAANGISGADAGKYGVVEPNHLSAPRNGHVYAQRPAADGIAVLENGMFVDYNVNGTVTLNGKYMVFNEEKLYDERLQSHRDFAQKTADSPNGKITPRVFLMETGDIFTTNTVVDGVYEAGNSLAVDAATGLLKVSETDAIAAVVAETTLPDGVTPAIKVQML